MRGCVVIRSRRCYAAPFHSYSFPVESPHTDGRNILEIIARSLSITGATLGKDIEFEFIVVVFETLSYVLLLH